ncbi:Uma2 family endonuclease [Roseburia hominis]
MDINDLKKLKLEKGITNQDIAELSGIPLSTINKIFSGATKNPRYATLLAIEQVLTIKEKIPFTYDLIKEEPMLIRESPVPYMYHARTYQNEDIEKLEEVRAELINGYLYMLAAPSRRHQRILTKLLFQIEGHIQKNNGKCQVYPAPFDVRIFGDNSTVVQPDLSVICKTEMLTDKGCTGAPDWLIEIASESNASHDYVTKMMQYQKAGVREYWIVDPREDVVYVYNFENPAKTGKYTFDDEIPSGVLEGLRIKIEV